MTSFKTRNNFSRLWKPQPEALPAFPPKASTRFPPRSNTYLITGLQNELTKSGVLKNMSDHEDFWKLVQEEALGEEIKERLQKIRFKLMNPRPWPAVDETKMLASIDQDNGGRQGAQSLLSRLTEWRKRCQQREVVPRLPHGQGESKIMSKTRTDSQSKRFLSQLDQMYSTSLANMEFSRRLLEREDRFADLLPEHRARVLAHAGRCSTRRNGGGGPPGPWPAASSTTCPPIPQVPQPRKSTEKFPLEDRKTPSDPVWHEQAFRSSEGQAFSCWDNRRPQADSTPDPGTRDPGPSCSGG
uniref:uncharacterized protein LOC125391579 isoform X2 n=1 Tax=Myodes glareolus TaxID=447135 RepID=UPI0020220B4A|nr:uncharacterized protein LOC125391579 isoform X2 [Myodes glareolus]